MNLKSIVGVLIVLVLILLGMSYGINGHKASLPGEYDALATCLADKGVKFYGAFWCPHCKEQKEKFGNSAKLLPYIECSTPDTKGQLQVCKDLGIEGYPTWIFPDGTRENKVLDPEEIGKKVACVPGGVTASTTPSAATTTTSVNAATTTP